MGEATESAAKKVKGDMMGKRTFLKMRRSSQWKAVHDPSMYYSVNYSS